MNDLISVIIPVKNGENYLEEAIKGILSQGMNAEIIVVDDCSTDKTFEIAKKSGCKIIRHETARGAVAAKNSGLKIAKGKYILFHDHDDIMKKGVLKKLYEEIDSDSEVMAVEAKVCDWYSPDLPKEMQAKIQIKQAPYWGLFTGAILIRKEVFNEIGYFDESGQAGEIIEWFSKMNTKGYKVKKIDFVSTMRRIHSTNFGIADKKTEFKNYAAILRAKIKKS